MIYAIQSGGYVKFGYSKKPKRRLSTIKISSPTACVMLGVKDGSVEDEKALHRRFSHLRASGEWFLMTSELREWIEQNMGPMPKTPRNPKHGGKRKGAGRHLKYGEETKPVLISFPLSLIEWGKSQDGKSFSEVVIEALESARKRAQK